MNPVAGGDGVGAVVRVNVREIARGGGGGGVKGTGGLVGIGVLADEDTVNEHPKFRKGVRGLGEGEVDLGAWCG